MGPCQKALLKQCKCIFTHISHAACKSSVIAADCAFIKAFSKEPKKQLPVNFPLPWMDTHSGLLSRGYHGMGESDWQLFFFFFDMLSFLLTVPGASMKNLTTSKQARKQASKQASKQAGKQASKQAANTKDWLGRDWLVGLGMK